MLNQAKVHKEIAPNNVNLFDKLIPSNHQLSWNSFFINGKQATDDFMSEIKKPAKNQK